MGKRNSVFISYFKNAFFFLIWNKMHLDAFCYCLSTIESPGRKDNTQVTQELPVHITFCILNWTSPFLHFCTKFRSNTICTWDIGIAGLAWFSAFSLPILQKRQSAMTIFWPYSSLWDLLDLPKPLTAVLSHDLWEFHPTEIRKLLLSREILL